MIYLCIMPTVLTTEIYDLFIPLLGILLVSISNSSFPIFLDQGDRGYTGTPGQHGPPGDMVMSFISN